MVILGIQDAGFRHLAPSAFRHGVTVLSFFRDLNELGHGIATPPLGEILTTRSAQIRMVNPEFGLFITRPSRVPPVFVAASYCLKGTIRLQGANLRAECQVSPWLITFVGSWAAGWLAIAGAVTAVGHGFVGLGLATIGCSWVTLPVGIGMHYARQAASDAVDDVAAILTERWDLARWYPDPNWGSTRS